MISILELLGYEIRLIKKSIHKVIDKNISLYENILKRKNPNYSFKNIQFYRNPGYSLETEFISQGEIISSIIKNAERALSGQSYNDIFVTAPTGAGKSVMFQIPAIYLAEESNLLTLIVTPLIGLMNDQVENIRKMSNLAATINSEYTPEEKEIIKQKIIENEISILYLSPETLLSNNPISNLIGERKIGLMIVDESHIVSTWGKSFRPDYWFLGDYISFLKTKLEYRFPIATFSATVTYGGNDDMHGDIIDSLKMKTGRYEYIAPMRRDDIHFAINVIKKENDYLKEKDELVSESLNTLLKNRKKTIAYFPYTSQVETFYRRIGGASVVGKYYGSLLKNEKNDAALNFKVGTINMMLATKAFGMGIDIDDIFCVYHYAPTGNLCDYIQEIGRAARRTDIEGIAKIDFFENDYRYIKQLFGMSSIKNYQIVEVLKKLREIYLTKKRRNFTISPDDFSYIFPLASDMQASDNLFKTVMLMIQKDFEKNPMVNFKPIIFKPRSMFTKGYLMIKEDEIKKLKRNRLQKYFKIYSSSKELATKYIETKVTKYFDRNTFEMKSFSHDTSVSVGYLGDIYTVDFKAMWEENYSDMSFAMFKYSFFKGELLEIPFSKDFIPEYILSVSTKLNCFETMVNKINNIFSQLLEDFSKMDIITKQFTLDEIAKIIENNPYCDLNTYESLSAAENIIRLINNYQIANNFGTQFVFKKNTATEKYTITSLSLLNRRVKAMSRDVEVRFKSVYKGKEKYFLLNLKNPNGIEKTCEMMIAQILEMFRLASYQVKSGERPEYFVRINSISAIEKILNNDYYQSEMVRIVRNRHEQSIKIMSYFFMKLNTDKERWDFVEKYFAGLINEI